jgi:hypothetical protein
MPAIAPVLATALVLFAAVVPVAAQGPPSSGPGLGALIDALDLTRTVRGWVVRHREGTLVLRGEDDRVYRINTAGLDRAALVRLSEGNFVTVALKASVTPGAMPIAASVEAGDLDPAAAPGAPPDGGAPR